MSPQESWWSLKMVPKHGRLQLLLDDIPFANDIHIVIICQDWHSLDVQNDMNLNLRAISRAMLQSGPSEYIIDATDKTILEVQNTWRSLLGNRAPRRLAGLSGDMMFKPYLHRQRLRIVVALGGLSECGKSTMGGLIETEFGQQGLDLALPLLWL
ncbi:hypothetical protein K438DRAFT_1954369 [Mycena galopus ATCC 62051]|nr:hypothetical protein K438DRAFT_1954369 [Mycena galopus ATCC 62051]